MAKKSVGTIARLKVHCLGNKAGTLGVCYEQYGTGLSFIFENGQYDGFSVKDQHRFLEMIGFEEKLSRYKFRSVVYLSEDYRKGFFMFAELRAKPHYTLTINKK